jgi:predicted MPP superfamily phosphohydrolase
MVICVDMSRHRGRHDSIFRRIGAAVLDAAVLGGIGARWSYRLGLHGTLSVTTHEIRVATEKKLAAPLVLAYASDFHAGATTDPALFIGLMSLLRERSPDVLLLGGDFVSWRANDVNAIAEALTQYEPPLGKYAVMGNHDLWAGDELIERRLRAVGVDVLVNRNIALPSPFDSVSICGIDDPWTGNADAAMAFKDAKPVRIFLTHSPDGILLLGGERYDVAFAGHTHGGQIALRDGTPIVCAGGPLSRSHSRGRFEVIGNGPLIVSRGVGCSNLPIRINADPELIICTLQ